MPSSPTWTTLLTALLISSLPATLATPLYRNARTPAAAATSTTTPVLPLDAVAPSALPAPDASWTLKALALGLGTQNYTCASAGAAPTPHGATAALYDALPALSGPAQRSAGRVPVLPCLALGMADPADPADPRAPPPRLPPDWQVTLLGQHYFTAAGTPTFELGPMALSARKTNGAEAPKGACKGKGGEGAVDWLLLRDVRDGTSRGLQAVYRVETAGGKPPASCAAAGEVVVPYAAEYWFYG